MARWYGAIGFASSHETAPGVFMPDIEERFYSGNVVRSSSRFQDGSTVNGEITISNNLSIVADPFAYKNFMHIRYAEWMENKWKVTNVEVEYPRLILTLGGLYE